LKSSWQAFLPSGSTGIHFKTIHSTDPWTNLHRHSLLNHMRQRFLGKAPKPSHQQHFDPPPRNPTSHHQPRDHKFICKPSLVEWKNTRIFWWLRSECRWQFNPNI